MNEMTIASQKCVLSDVHSYNYRPHPKDEGRSTPRGGTPARFRQGGGYPIQPWADGVVVPQPGPDGGVPHPALDGGTPARSRLGYPRYSHAQGWGTPGQVQMRGGYPGYPPARDGVVPPPPVRTTEGVLATWRSVYLSRSRRRTFLLNHQIGHNVLEIHNTTKFKCIKCQIISK